MPVTMICPNLKCRSTIVTPDSTRGRVVRCSRCKQLLMVPIRETAPPKREEPTPTPEG